jgi:hypothetical protein
MKTLVFFFALLSAIGSISAQELYPYSEPASNMPAKAIGIKMTSMFMRGVHSDKMLQRHMPEVMLGINKNLMLHAGLGFSDMHEEKFMFEAVRIYGKYRVLSLDDVHKHFRVALFSGLAYSRNHLDHNEINLMGDQSGFQAGVIATQLWNRLAVSGTGSWNEVLHRERRNKLSTNEYAFTGFNYSLSAGFLLLPVEYRDYDQTNVNLYLELLGSRNIGRTTDRYYVDLAPALQFIFNSTGKLNLGYRFNLSGDIYRLTNRSFMIGYEHLFLNALRKKKGRP